MPLITGSLALIIFVAGILAGGMGGLLGLGGGVFLVPFLHLVLGFPLKSAAASVEKAVGSKFGRSPTVATSCPVRSTSSAQRALQSVRNRSNARVISAKSSSVNDQLDEPTGIDSILIQGGFHVAEYPLAAPA